MSDEVTYETKMARLKRLKTRIDELENAVAEKMVGTTQRVVVEAISKKDQRELAGRTDNNRVVNFVGSKNLVGQFVEVKIAAVSMHTLRGELIGMKKLATYS
jgi:tRNA-2-methylthio-N6-dimethylallyladenosine synthase